MNLVHLHYFIEVAGQGTISKAAENLHVSHSAIGSICRTKGKMVLKLSLEILHKLKEMRNLGQDHTDLKET